MLSSQKPVHTRLAPAVSSTLAEAGTLIQGGDLVAFPTETVYGLGANALEERAVAKVFGAKRRPRINPLIVHVPDIAEAKKLVEFNDHAAMLAKAFWPGGLTLVLPRRASCPLALLVSAGLDSVAVRAPAHPIAQALLVAAGVPIAAPSANRSGHVSPTTAAHVLEELEGRVSMVLDGGACQIGLESTIIGFEGGKPILLRKGAIPRDAIEKMVGPISAPAHGKLLSAGMMASHYAPDLEIRLNANSAQPNEALLAFGKARPSGACTMLNLSPSGDLTEAAANLFSMMRILDKSGAKRIAVMPIPSTGLGEAINDRLARAAAPRDGRADEAANFD